MELIENRDITKPEMYLRVKSEDVLKLMEFFYENKIWFTYKPWQTLDDDGVWWHQFYICKEKFYIYKYKIQEL